MTMYDDDFYDIIDAGAYTSATIVLPLVFKELGWTPSSVIDIGCGTAAWLKAALELGVEDVCGIDGEYNKVAPKVIGDDFQPLDLTKPFESSFQFNLAICLEVAEHLPEACADDLVKSVANCSDTILWSAAAPGQRGLDHVNEQWPSYWASKFKDMGYFCNSEFRYKIWNKSSVETWYKQNILIFSRHRSDWTTPVRDLIHPKNYSNYEKVEDENIYIP